MLRPLLFLSRMSSAEALLLLILNLATYVTLNEYLTNLKIGNEKTICTTFLEEIVSNLDSFAKLKNR